MAPIGLRCTLWSKIAGDDMMGVLQRISWSVLWVTVLSCGGRVAPAGRESDFTSASTGGSGAGTTTTLPLATPATNASSQAPHCDPGTSIFYVASGYVLDIAQDDAWLYVQTLDEILRVSKDGSGVTQSLVKEASGGLFQGQRRLAVHDDTVYWGHGNDGSIWRTRAGGDPEPFVAGIRRTTQATNLIVADDALYFLRDGHVNVMDLGDTSECNELDAARQFVADADGYYFMSERDANDELLFAGANLYGERRWESRLPAGSDLLGFDGNFVYYLVSDENESRLQRRDKSEKGDELVTTSTLLDDEMNLAADHDDVFWSLQGSLYHVRIGKGTAAELVSKQGKYDVDDYGGFILIDADYVYWQANVDTKPHDDRDPLPILRTCRADLSR